MVILTAGQRLAGARAIQLRPPRAWLFCIGFTGLRASEIGAAVTRLGRGTRLALVPDFAVLLKNSVVIDATHRARRAHGRAMIRRNVARPIRAHDVVHIVVVARAPRGRAPRRHKAAGAEPRQRVNGLSGRGVAVHRAAVAVAVNRVTAGIVPGRIPGA